MVLFPISAVPFRIILAAVTELQWIAMDKISSSKRFVRVALCATHSNRSENVLCGHIGFLHKNLRF